VGGWEIIETMGLRVTKLRSSSGLAANIGAVTAIFGATGLGIPISTTHAAATSITGAGVASGHVDLNLVAKMVAVWSSPSRPRSSSRGELVQLVAQPWERSAVDRQCWHQAEHRQTTPKTAIFELWNESS
jgi:hypothetical protein